MCPENRRCATVMVPGWGASAPAARGWTYWVPSYIADLKDGDWVIVESPRDEKGHLVEQSGIPIAATVIDAKPPVTICKKATRWLVSKIDWDPYRALQALALNGDDDDGL